MDLDVRAREVGIEHVRAVGVADLREPDLPTVVGDPEGTTHQREFSAAQSPPFTTETAASHRTWPPKAAGVTTCPTLRAGGAFCF